jgi:hypothetical protein
MTLLINKKYVCNVEPINTINKVIVCKVFISIVVMSIFMGKDESLPGLWSPLTACIRQQCRKLTVSSHHRCLINTSVEKMNNI